MNLDVLQLKIQMARASMNIADLSIAANLNKNTIASYTSGKRKPTTKALGLLAKALNCDVTDLLKKDGV